MQLPQDSRIEDAQDFWGALLGVHLHRVRHRLFGAMSRPSKSILDPSFQWVPSHKTDIRRTWEKARKKQEQPTISDKVKPIRPTQPLPKQRSSARRA